MRIRLITLLAVFVWGMFSAQMLWAQDKDETKTDKYGRKYYQSKKEAHFSKYRWINKAKVPMFAENSEFSATVTMLETKDFVEIADGKLGLELTKIRIFDRSIGYLEGWTKNQFLHNKDYYGEPLELSDLEINRRKEAALQRKQDIEDRKKRQKEQEKTDKLNGIIAAARADNKNVFGMSFEQLSGYLKKSYKEDAAYNENASKTVKFVSKDAKWPTALYFSMENRKVNGVLIYNNSNGLPEKQADVLLYEMAQECFYSLEDVKNINDNITKSTGKLEKSGMNITVKTDNSKESPFIELSVGNFSGIE